jgi:PhzF family phenazine biosynthesis protein
MFKKEGRVAIRMYHVDAFTGQAFSGNPAAVCLLEKPMPDAWMQHVAAEMNLSETAFILPEKDGFRLRWFTPKVEVELCGHATLASAHILFTTSALRPIETARFYTQSGLLTAVCKDGWIELNFPSQPPRPDTLPDQAIRALGVNPLAILRFGEKCLVEVATESEVCRLQPDFQALLTATPLEIIVTSRASRNGFDFISRFFAPGVGINEDPVTGSAHCLLTPYWSEKLEKLEMNAFQASARGGALKVRLEGDRVLILGHAVTVLVGELAA